MQNTAEKIEAVGHTPGPWNIRTLDYSPEFYIENERGQQIVQSGEGLCNPADARLIAAAPELLAECEAALRLLEQAYANRKNQPQVISNVRAAIAKAKEAA